MLKTLNFIRKLNKNKKKAIWLKTSHFREGKRKLPALGIYRDLERKFLNRLTINSLILTVKKINRLRHNWIIINRIIINGLKLTGLPSLD